MDKVTKQGAYRARCVFDSFVAGRMQDGDIQGPGDLLGWVDLAADDQDTVEGQITQYLHSKNGSNNDSSPSTSNVNTIPTSSLPATSLPTTSLSPPPPSPHHLPLPTTSLSQPPPSPHHLHSCSYKTN